MTSDSFIRYMLYANASKLASTRKPPTNLTLPVIAGTGYVSETLTVTSGNWSSFPAPTYTYQWKLNGSNIGGATTNSYVVQLGDVGGSITCTVTANNGVNPNGTATSAGKTALASASPSNSVAPVVSGSVISGSTLSCTTGTWTGTPTPTYQYQWQAGGVDIPDATNSTYVTQYSQGSVAVRCGVRATNLVGTSGYTYSNAITVETVPTINTGPSVSGNPTTTSTLTRTNGTYYGYPSPTISGQWLRNGAAFSPARTSSTCYVDAGLEGVAITWSETATNTNGTSAANVSTAKNILSPTLTQPVLEITSAIDDPTPDGNYIVYDVAAGDVTRIQYSTDGFATIGAEATDTLSGAGDTVGVFSGTSLANGSWEARLRHERGTNPITQISLWSTSYAFTVSVVVSDRWGLANGTDTWGWSDGNEIGLA